MLYFYQRVKGLCRTYSGYMLKEPPQTMELHVGATRTMIGQFQPS